MSTELYTYVYACVRAKLLQSCRALCSPMDCSPPGSSVHGNSPGKNTTVGYHVLLQGIFPTQGLNPGLPHCRQILYQLSHQGSPSYPSRFSKAWFELPESHSKFPPATYFAYGNVHVSMSLSMCPALFFPSVSTSLSSESASPLLPCK